MLNIAAMLGDLVTRPPRWTKTGLVSVHGVTSQSADCSIFIAANILFLGVKVLANEWDEYAESWDADDSVQEYARKAFEELSKVINIDGLSVFDFGCGTGTLTQLLSPAVKVVVALDSSSEMVKLLDEKNLGNVSTISGLLTKDLIDSHPYLSNKFDLIVASSVCGFLPDYEKTIGLLKSLLVSGGLFIQWDWLSKGDGSKTGLSENRVLHALKTNEFIDIQVKKPFELNSSNGSMTVLMAVGKSA
jgi:SAM-dependent methyltransferase